MDVWEIRTAQNYAQSGFGQNEVLLVNTVLKAASRMKESQLTAMELCKVSQSLEKSN